MAQTYTITFMDNSTKSYRNFGSFIKKFYDSFHLVKETNEAETNKIISKWRRR